MAVTINILLLEGEAGEGVGDVQGGSARGLDGNRYWREPFCNETFVKSIRFTCCVRVGGVYRPTAPNKVYHFINGNVLNLPDSHPYIIYTRPCYVGAFRKFVRG